MQHGCAYAGACASPAAGDTEYQSHPDWHRLTAKITNHYYIREGEEHLRPLPTHKAAVNTLFPLLLPPHRDVRQGPIAQDHILAFWHAWHCRTRFTAKGGFAWHKNEVLGGFRLNQNANWFSVLNKWNDAEISLGANSHFGQSYKPDHCVPRNHLSYSLLRRPPLVIALAFVYIGLKARIRASLIYAHMHAASCCQLWVMQHSGYKKGYDACSNFQTFLKRRIAKSFATFVF